MDFVKTAAFGFIVKTSICMIGFSFDRLWKDRASASVEMAQRHVNGQWLASNESKRVPTMQPSNNNDSTMMTSSGERVM